jgi:hypothetical protein
MIKSSWRAIIAAALTLAVTSCAASTETHPARTASEELLISSAADRAADQLKPKLPKGAKVYVDATNFEGYDAKYAIGAIRASLLKQGNRLVDSKQAADVVVEIRAGALSTDEQDTLVGLPSMNLPIPLAGSLPVPQIALYQRHIENGVAKFAATSYDAKDGNYIDDTASDAALGRSHTSTNTVLFVFSWTMNDTAPTVD